jgi:hypothetical protein
LVSRGDRAQSFAQQRLRRVMRRTNPKTIQRVEAMTFPVVSGSGHEDRYHLSMGGLLHGTSCL